MDGWMTIEVFGEVFIPKLGSVNGKGLCRQDLGTINRSLLEDLTQGLNISQK